MLSTLAVAVLAAVGPASHLDSVALAAYWHKKDARGRGDEVSEREVPKRYPAFAISEDTFLVSDPLVRTGNLERIEICFRGATVPAVESARADGQCAVVLKSERPVPGIAPLEFSAGSPAFRLRWQWVRDALAVKLSETDSNEFVTAMAESGRVFRQGSGDSLYLDADGRPVGLDFGARTEIAAGGSWRPCPPREWKLSPAESYEQAASMMERRVAEASLGVLIRLEPEEKGDSRRQFRVVDFSDDANKNDIDALGFAIGGRIFVPSSISGDKIARLSRAEAVFPDGSKTNLVFAGALADWNAIIFDAPGGFEGKLRPLEIASGEADGFDNRIAWAMSVENENGRIVASARRARFFGVELARGGVRIPAISGGFRRYEDYDYNRRTVSFRFGLDGEGRIAAFALARRFAPNRWSSGDAEGVPTADLVRFLALEGCNPEFAPRREEDRNMLVWLGVETVRLNDALARERNAQSFLGRYQQPPYVTEVYPGSPAAKAGIVAGDVLLAIRRGAGAERKLEAENEFFTRDWGEYFSSDARPDPIFMGQRAPTPWPDVENQINTMLSSFGAGAKVTLVYARDGVRREAEILLEAAPVHYRNAAKSRNRQLGLSVKDMTFEVRRYFKFGDADPGVVIAKVKPGSPAAVAGLKPYELVTEVNGEKVRDAKDFAAKTKGARDLVFAVRRLAQTHIVKIGVGK